MDLAKKISEKNATIAIVGLGYVGIPTALEFAKQGFNVMGIDIDENKVKLINSGKSPINLPSIEKDIAELVAKKKIKAYTDLEEVIPKSDFVLLILPTPVNEAKEPDLSYIVNAGKSLSKYLKKDQLIILESTVYPGVTEDVLLPILLESGLECPNDFGIAYCPERFNPGDPKHTVEKVTRVIGAINSEWADVAALLYSQIQKIHITVNIKTAEAAKVIENTQRDLNIALMNEIALICEKLQIDVKDVIEAASTKWNFLKFSPGPGVGGHCLPHDPYYLVKIARELGYNAQIIIAGRKVNDEMPYHVADLLVKALNYKEKAISKSKVIIFGATYKKNIDDIRSSPTEILVKKLEEYNVDIQIIEPNIKETTVFGQKSSKDFDIEMISNADALILMVDHDSSSKFTIDFFKKCFEKNKNLVIVDGVRILDGEKIKEIGLIYQGIGAGNINNSYKIGEDNV
ncbi:MAG: nucleotide sugar dehydrogenase [Candidatus Heimdallarchaeota archaeon]